VPRILTYNVHACRGLDERPSPGRIADVIAAARPDIVALQELDVGRARSGELDQAEVIARELGMDFHFHPARRIEGERYGAAILSALPLRLVKAGSLPERGAAHRSSSHAARSGPRWGSATGRGRCR
jgi:endonuclease/exonuclease/phosphatase family metal-dependent hydrolase